MSKKGYIIWSTVLLASLMLSLILGCAPPSAPPSGEEAMRNLKARVVPTVIVIPHIVERDPKTQMVIMGSNFERGQEIHVIVCGQGQPPSDITHLLSPEPIPDEAGVWITVWTFAEYDGMLRNIAANGGEGTYTLQATDSDFNPLASTPFAIAVTKDKAEKEWPSWAKVLLKK